jgi:hypothetical protein
MALQEPVRSAGGVKRGAGLPRAWPVLFLAFALGGVSACAQGSSPNYGQDFGTISLAAGQAQQVWIGPSYWLLRVCNDFGSAGTVTAIIGEQPSATLPPGHCVEDYGNRIQFTNTGGGAATLTYRPIVQPFTP